MSNPDTQKNVNNESMTAGSMPDSEHVNRNPSPERGEAEAESHSEMTERGKAFHQGINDKHGYRDRGEIKNEIAYQISGDEV